MLSHALFMVSMSRSEYLHVKEVVSACQRVSICIICQVNLSLCMSNECESLHVKEGNFIICAQAKEFRVVLCSCSEPTESF